MDNEKIKSEMAKVIDDRIQEARRWVGSLNKGMGMWIAEGIVPQGYGHIPTAIKEFAKRLKEEFKKDEYDNWWGEDAYHNARIIIDEIVKEYKND